MNIPQFSSLHNLLFYPRLAGTNMKKNKSIYFPYLCAGSLMAGLLYVLNSVGIMVEDSGMAVSYTHLPAAEAGGG